MSSSRSRVLLSVVWAATLVGCGYPVTDYTTSAGLGDSSSDTSDSSELDSTMDSSDDTAGDDADVVDGAEACGTGLTNCSGVGCVDTSNDPGHCGACTGVCAKYGICSASACGCPTDTIACGASGPGTCTATNDDPTACAKSSCVGAVCKDAEYCNDGTCACRPGLTSCGGTCVDEAGDEKHCGACAATACKGAEACVKGVCVKNACPLGRTPCGRSCLALAKDPAHCGATCAVAKVCAKNQVCIAGACVGYVPAVGCTDVGGCNCTKFFAAGKACPGFPGKKLPAICVDAASCPVAPPW